MQFKKEYSQIVARMHNDWYEGWGQCLI